jgi:toxin ParE1/3/4
VSVKRYRVGLSDLARADLRELAHYVRQRDGAPRAKALMADMLQTIGTLEKFPERGRVPSEIAAVSKGELREITTKGWRVLYRLGVGELTIIAVFDGRRDVQSLLHKRLMTAPVIQ